MKRLISLIFLIFFAGMVLLGFAFSGHLMINHEDCINSTLTGSACPASLADFVLHHLALFQIVSQTTAPSFSNGVLFIVFSLVLIFFSLFRKTLHGPPNFLLFRPTKYRDFFKFRTKNPICWLALFELSPSI